MLTALTSRTPVRWPDLRPLLISVALLGAFGCDAPDAGPESSWRWIQGGPADHVWDLRIQRAGWRHVGTFERAGESYAEWAWMIDVRRLHSTFRRFEPVRVWVELRDEAGLEISASYSYQHLHFEDGEIGHLTGREEVIAHRLTNDARLHLIRLGVGRGNCKLPPPQPCYAYVDPTVRRGCVEENIGREMECDEWRWVTVGGQAG